jgi:hypothetical protein
LHTVGDLTFHLYGISVPHAGWAIGTDTRSHILECESYEGEPGWGTNVWKEECAANGQAQQDRPLTVTPGFTDNDCEEGLALLVPDLTEVCSGGDPFESLLGAGVGPAECGWDCAHLWSVYASGCAQFLGRVYPDFEAFGALCATKSDEMTVLEYDGHLEEGQSDDHDFTAQQQLVYSIGPGRGR